MVGSRLRAGVGELDITGGLGSPLAYPLSDQSASAVRDELMAKVVVLADGETALAIVTLDLLALTNEDAERAVGAISQAAGIGPDAIMLVCSHTRGAPCTAPVVGQPEVHREYAAEVAGKLADAVARARDDLQDASLGVGCARLPHLIYNHRLVTRNMRTIAGWMGVPRDEVLEPEGPIDPTFSVMVIRDARGDPICLLWNFPADNRFDPEGQISAHLPGLVQKEVDERSGVHLPSLYLAGCGGNVSYVHDLERSADAVASAVMAVQLETSCDPLIGLSFAREKMVLPIQDYSEFWSEPDVELKHPDALEAFAREAELLREEGAEGVGASVQALGLGRFAIAALPGVPFVEFALDIKEGSPFAATLVAANSGGYPGYVCTRKAFEHGGFETWAARSSKIGPGGGEFIAARAGALLNRLWSARSPGKRIR
jgi:neutral ceramidase